MFWVRLVGAVLLCAGMLHLSSDPCQGACPVPVLVNTLIRVNQWGYPSTAEKVAVLANPITGYNSAESYTPPATMQLRRASDGAVMHSGPATAWNSGNTHAQSGDQLWWYDFSSVQTEDVYYVFDSQAQARSDLFPITANPYRQVARQALRMFFYQRSGLAKAAPYTDAKWADGAAFLGTNQDPTARLVTDQGNAGLARDLQGGWFDAGDYNKYTVFTTRAVTDLLHAYLVNPTAWGDDLNIPESSNGIPDILDEVKWGLDFLRRMQQGNGSVLSKVSELGKTVTSPPSADTHARFYGAASTISTACAAGVFALGAKVFNGIGQTGTGGLLQTAAVNAWTWANANTVRYDNTGFATVNPETYDPGSTPPFKQSDYEMLLCKIQAAAYLYALTSESTYKTFVENNYTSVTAINTTYWTPFPPNSLAQHALLYYAAQPGVSAGVKSSIESSFNTGALEYPYLKPVTDQADGYRAWLGDGEYVWGSNMIKSTMAIHHFAHLRYNLDTGRATQYRHAGAGYIHYLLGVNPNAVAFLTNMYGYGCKRCVNETWHLWFYQGTDWSNALTSPKGPAPGYLAGGPNEQYGMFSGPVTAPTPPYGQPRQKSWLDDNFDNGGAWPQWEITEPGIYYQAAFLHGLASLLTAP